MSDLIAATDRSDKILSLTASRIRDLGGDDAVRDYLHHTLHTVLGLTVDTAGPIGACRLMEEGLQTAEHIAEDDA